MNFSDALNELKNGNKIARKGWNGAGQFLYHIPAAHYPAQTAIAKEEFGEMVPYTAYIAIKTVQNTVAPWLPSQTDVLAEDWEVVT